MCGRVFFVVWCSVLRVFVFVCCLRLGVSVLRVCILMFSFFVFGRLVRV